MTSARRPARGVRRCFGLVCAVAAIGLLTSAPATAGNTSPAQTELRLTALSPVSLQPGGTFKADGTFTTDKTLDHVVVQFDVGTSPFTTRTELAEAASSPAYTIPVTGGDDDLGKVKAGESKSFRIRIDANSLGFPVAGVYPMRIAALNVRTGGELSEINSFVPWAPDVTTDAATPTQSRLLMFWPLIDQPLPDSSDAGTSAVQASVTGGGRLATLLRTGARAPATWLVDPALLDDVATLDDPAAQQWLDSYTTASSKRHVVALPYGDPDLASIAESGDTGMLAAARDKGDRVFENHLPDVRVPPSDFAWPADGAADQSVIDAAARAQDNVMLIDEQTAPLLTELTYTPSGRLQSTDPNMELLLADRTTSALVASPASTTNDVLLARQRFLAETLLHKLENSASRLLVVAPPRRWDPSPLWADELVSAIRHANWLEPVSINEALQPNPPSVLREQPSIPDASASRQLPPSMVDAAQHALVDNHRLAAILTKPRQVTAPIEDALFTSLSTAWRTDIAAAQASQAQTVDRLESQRSRVRIVSSGGTLSADRGSFPITVRNQLDQKVKVLLSAVSDDTLRLRVDAPSQVIRIPPQSSVSVPVNLDAVTSGHLSFQTQLLTPRGAAYNDPVTINVDVTGFGKVTLLVFGAAAGLMVVAAAIRITRRIRAARRAPS